MRPIMSRVTTLLLVVWVYAAASMCPLDCFCGLDERGRRKTSCLQGGLIGPIQVSTIDKGTQVLEVKAPPDNPNWLLVGPFFQSLLSLEELRITRSGLPEIGKHTFWGVKNLEVLDLSLNNISALQDHNFRGLANLQELYLEDNRVEHLSSGTFKYLTDLRVLSLARNRLQDVMNRVFERLSKLQKLNLSGNPLVELHPEIFMDVQELQVLECRRCGLRNVNTQIYHLLQQLNTLDLGENEFYYLANDEFQELRRLKRLWMDGNHLPVVLERTFVTQRHLLQVSFARNRLAKVTGQAFLNVTTLTDLDLSYNKYMRLDSSVFRPLAGSLRRLELNGVGVPLLEVRELLEGVSGLEHLGLADMNMSEVPIEAFTSYNKLRSLNLSGNALNSVSYPLLAPLVELKQLDLSRNKIRGFDETTVRRLDSLDVVVLSGNQWLCDVCNVLPMWELSNSSAFWRTVECSTPKSLKSRTLGSLREKDLVRCGEADAIDAAGTLSALLKENANVILITATSIGATLLFIVSIACVRACCFRRTELPYIDEDKIRRTTDVEKIADTATAVFGQNGEISFKFPLDVERKAAALAAIATIDPKKEAKLPNGDL